MTIAPTIGTAAARDRAPRLSRAILDYHNRRLKLYGLGPTEFAGLRLEDAGGLPHEDGALYTKATVYSPSSNEVAWQGLGFRHEGYIARYFADGRDAHLWASYTDPDRAHETDRTAHQEGLRLALRKPPVVPVLPDGFAISQAGVGDARDISELLGATFSDYPSALDHRHLSAQIDTGANLFCCLRDASGQLVATASAELDAVNRSAEMTDCATLPSARGRGLMACLLWHLAHLVEDTRGITDLYTLARADEIGMNCVFAKLGYRYTGRLTNNCRMPNGWESVNIWCKPGAPGDRESTC